MSVHLEGGHTDSILTVDCTKDGSGQVFTGGEGGTLCHWHHDGSLIGSVNLGEGCDVASVLCLTLRPDLLFASAGDQIVQLDRRQLSAPVEQYASCAEEINQLAVNDKEEYLAACDDTGHVKIFSMATRKVYKTLKRHTNICASIAFRPKRPWDLLSGGYDQRLLSWDFSRARVLCDVNISEVGVGPDQFDNYLVNPPFIHSISLAANGHLLACGTENALVHIFDTSKRTPTYMTALRDHTHGVSQVHFPKFDEYTLITGGNDGVCNLWRLNNIAVTYQVNGYARSSSSSHNNSTSDNASTSGDSVTNSSTSAASEDPSAGEEGAEGGAAPEEGVEEGEGEAAQALSSPRPCFGILHEEKINWITTGATANRKFIVVADNTNEATIYNYPDN